MKKFLMALILMIPMSVYAWSFPSVGIENDVSVSSNGWTVSVDQNGGNAVSVGTSGLLFTNSDDVRLGVSYDTPLLWGLSGGTSWKYTTDHDHVLGVNTAIDYWGANLDTAFEWNLNEMDFDASVGTGYTAFGLDGSVTSNWDIDRFSYEGIDVSSGYTWAVTDTFSVRPNVTVPFDGSFGLGDITAGVSISLSFGSTPSE